MKQISCLSLFRFFASNKGNRDLRTRRARTIARQVGSEKQRCLACVWASTRIANRGGANPTPRVREGRCFLCRDYPPTFIRTGAVGHEIGMLLYLFVIGQYPLRYALSCTLDCSSFASPWA